MSTKCPSKACVCSIISCWLIVAFIVFIVTCVLYLSPFLRILRYTRTRCRVESSFFTTQFVCPCPAQGLQCPSYPCFLAHVSLNYSGDGQTWVVNLFEDDLQQASVLGSSDDQKEMCTLRACHEDDLHNRRRVMQFQQKFGTPGKFLNCSYDPWDVRSGAVLTVHLPGWEIFHSVLWPAVGVALGLVACAVFCRCCRRQRTAAEAAAAAGEGCVSGWVDENNEVGVKIELCENKFGGNNSTPTRRTELEENIAAAKALLAAQQKRRHKRSIRNLWMIQQDV